MFLQLPLMQQLSLKSYLLLLLLLGLDFHFSLKLSLSLLLQMSLMLQTLLKQSLLLQLLHLSLMLQTLQFHFSPRLLISFMLEIDDILMWNERRMHRTSMSIGSIGTGNVIGTSRTTPLMIRTKILHQSCSIVHSLRLWGLRIRQRSRERR